MRRNFRPLSWIEVGLAAVTGLLALITPVFPDWIEFVSGWDPDQHDGSVERMIVVGLFVVTIVMVALVAIEWRRTQPRRRHNRSHDDRRFPRRPPRSPTSTAGDVQRPVFSA